jgi:benzoyl-CoA reductase/2-hydroxyglutaryl-CoA dehydratase subunit BcrC/BadD/HgdB
MAWLSGLDGTRAVAKEGKDEPDKSSSTASAYDALVKEFDQAMEAFQKVYAAAKTDAERQKALEDQYPQPEKFAGRFLKLAQRDPKSATAADAAVWVVSHARSGEESNQALDLLLEHHLESPKLGDVCLELVYSDVPMASQTLRTVREKSPHREAQGKALFALANRTFRDSPAEAEKLFEEVAAKFADVAHWRGNLGDAANAYLFEMRHLAIGKVAPQIEGEDVEGVKFKLSEYRGKVVVLDFWGDW